MEYNALHLGSGLRLRYPLLADASLQKGRGGKGKTAKKMKHSKLAACKLYISEGRNAAALEAIERAAGHHPQATITKKFPDYAYNRTRYTIVSYLIEEDEARVVDSPLRQALFAMAEEAYKTIELGTQCGAHPRVGVVDHISFHPLAQSTLHEVANLAKLVAADIGGRLHVPVLLYEAADPQGRALSSLRRELDYFTPNFMGNQWAGWSLPNVLPISPDEGPQCVDQDKGVVFVGASPWVDNYNIPVLTKDVDLVRTIARRVSARGGGLPGVQALALLHGDKLEIASMFLEPDRIGDKEVQREVELLASEEGLRVEKGYYTDLSKETTTKSYMKLASAD
ncbi:uncharacterized protein LOC116246478 isoform X2 [Nymphaea colorata]|uniref:uncharacterized protein LOC116246478 isoform X2 n=1 Tax=Nymphaea colorata TaxID=210225 RepID=UPI00129D512E|nr:uncharacterized protein LOC116246478 isoform X2 [Nymphaea colorata]